MTTAAILLLILFTVLMAIIAYPSIRSFLNTPEKIMIKQSQKVINESTHVIDCTNGENRLIYTYEIYPCTYARVTLERSFIDGRYVKSHQFSGDVNKAMTYRIGNLERLDLKEKPVVTGLS